jgi:hypothetical protein
VPASNSRPASAPQSDEVGVAGVRGHAFGYSSSANRQLNGSPSSFPVPPPLPRFARFPTSPTHPSFFVGEVGK